MSDYIRSSSPIIATDYLRHNFLAILNKLRKKLFFGFLFFCLLSAYSMENYDDTLRDSFCNAVELACKNGFSIEDCEIIKDYIIKGANPNWPITKDKKTILHIVIKNQKKELFEFLLKNKADINIGNKNDKTPFHYLIQTYNNHKKLEMPVDYLIKNKADINAKAFFYELHSYSGYMNYLIQHGSDDANKILTTALGVVIDPLCDKTSIVKELCKLKASLVNVTPDMGNIFRRIITLASDTSQTSTDNGTISAQYIKSIITHARFDNFDNFDKGSKTVLCTLLVFQRLEETEKIKLPKDIKLRILAHLDLFDLYHYKKLCKELLQNNYHHILLPQVHERVKNIKQILATPNYENRTALQLVLSKFYNNHRYINKISPFFDGTLLQKNYDDFIKDFPTILNSELEEDKNNLARQMFDNCVELFLEPDFTQETTPGMQMKK